MDTSQADDQYHGSGAYSRGPAHRGLGPRISSFEVQSPQDLGLTPHPPPTPYKHLPKHLPNRLNPEFSKHSVFTHVFLKKHCIFEILGLTQCVFNKNQSMIV